MATIYLIRHGQASFAREEYDQLSEMGLQQAAHLGKHLALRLGQFDQVYLGGMRRHMQTAEACLTAMGTDPDNFSGQVDPQWNEYDHQNILKCFDKRFAHPKAIQEFVAQQENPKEAFKLLFDQAVAKWLNSTKDGEYTESWRAYTSRIHGALKKMADGATGSEKIAVFTSGGPIALLSQALLGVPEHKLMQLNWTLVNCGVSKLVSSQNGVILSTLNEHSAFEGQFRSMISYK